MDAVLWSPGVRLSLQSLHRRPLPAPGRCRCYHRSVCVCARPVTTIDHVFFFTYCKFKGAAHLQMLTLAVVSYLAQLAVQLASQTESSEHWGGDGVVYYQTFSS